MKIFKIIIYSAVVTMALTCCAHAQEITLEKSFWSGWKYSTDGENYEKVGMGAEELRYLMADNPACVSELESYGSKKTIALVTGIAGGGLVGWPLGGYLATNEWKDSYTIMLAIGIPLSVISAVIDNSSTKNLKEAVSIYNDALVSDAGRLRFNIGYAKKTDIAGIEVRLSF